MKIWVSSGINDCSGEWPCLQRVPVCLASPAGLCLSQLPYTAARNACRYYLNGNDAYRLKLLLPNGEDDAGYGSRPFPEDTLHEVHGAAEALQALSVG